MQSLKLKIVLPSGNHAIYEIEDRLIFKTPGGIVDTLKIRQYGRHIATRFYRDWFIFTHQKAKSASKKEAEEFDSTPQVGEDAE